MPVRRAMTLIEMLVVISLIALLIAVLLPALAGARGSARLALCLANQQQLLAAVHNYAHDYNDRIPFGPRAHPPSVANFYPGTGMVTSIISRPPGEPVAAGLLLPHYLNHRPDVMFCPGADDPLDAATELALVRTGTDYAISNYYYRHGSGLQNAQPEATDHIVLHNLGKNSRGQAITALFIDQNFHAQGGAFFKVLQPRTNHAERFANAGYADGHAETHDNHDRAFSIDVGFFPAHADDRILEVFEHADGP